MGRLHLFELQDLDAWPTTLGEAGTAYLHALFEKMGVPALLAPVVKDALDRTGQDQLLDLCSGSGGPMPGVAAALGVPLTLTDHKPQPTAWAQFPGVAPHPHPVDARAVPDLPGLRTLCNGFHHFEDADATAILANAAGAGAPILIIELSERSAPAVVASAFIPLMVLLVMPFVRPVRLHWLLLTYVVPVLPWAIAWDGLVSHLRCRTTDELEALGRAAAPEWRWEARRVPLSGPAAATVLLGHPSD